MPEKWRVRKKDGKIYGPVDVMTMRRWIEEKRVLPEEEVSPEGVEEWKKVSKVPEFSDLFTLPEEKEEKPQEVVCPVCGKSWPPDTTFCVNCGTNLVTGKKIKGVIVEESEGGLLVTQCLRDGLRALKENPFSIAGMAFLYFLIQGIVSHIPRFSTFFYLLITPALLLGFYSYCLKRIRGENPGVGVLFQGFQQLFPAIVVFILINLSVFLGSLFFIIPGVFLSLAFSFSFFRLFDEPKGPIQALKESFLFTQGYRWRVMAIFVLGSLLNLLGFLCLGVGIFFTFPVSFLSVASLYERIKLDKVTPDQRNTDIREIIIALIPVLLAVLFIGILLASGLPKLLKILKGLPQFKHLPFGSIPGGGFKGL